MAGVRWYTNLDIKQRHEELILVKKYAGHEDEYPKYDNYDAIEVSKVANIPLDYDGVMGVPITFLDKYSPEQFEILGCTSAVDLSGGMARTPSDMFLQKVRDGMVRTGGTPGRAKPCWIDCDGYANVGYHRLLVRNKHPEL